jgi:hypothetical protein
MAAKPTLVRTRSIVRAFTAPPSGNLDLLDPHKARRMGPQVGAFLEAELQHPFEVLVQLVERGRLRVSARYAWDDPNVELRLLVELDVGRERRHGSYLLTPSHPWSRWGS